MSFESESNLGIMVNHEKPLFTIYPPSSILWRKKATLPMVCCLLVFPAMHEHSDCTNPNQFRALHLRG